MTGWEELGDWVNWGLELKPLVSEGGDSCRMGGLPVPRGHELGSSLPSHHSQVFAGAGPRETPMVCQRDTHKPPQSSMHTKMSEVGFMC